MCGGEVNYHVRDDRRLEQIILDDDADAVSLTPEEEALLYRYVFFVHSPSSKD